MALNAPTPAQRAAWEFYGDPDGTAFGDMRGNARPVGELGDIVDWHAAQQTRLNWRLVIDGDESWSLVLPDGGGTVTSNAAQGEPEEDDHPINATRTLFEAMGINDRTIEQFATNFMIAGECHYGYDRAADIWRVVSVIRQGRQQIVDQCEFATRLLWKHPADPNKPYSPTFRVLDILADLVWLNRMSRAQSRNRALLRGILMFADTLKNAKGESGEAFWNDLDNSLNEPMLDPDTQGPVGIMSAEEVIENGLKWVIPNFPYDTQVSQRELHLIDRLAMSMPIPKEVLTGIQAASRATAFQIEESSYRQYVEPFGYTIGNAIEEIIKAFLPNVGKVNVVPDPAALLARKSSVADTRQAYIDGVANGDYYREVAGIPTSAKPDEEDFADRRRIAEITAASRPSPSGETTTAERQINPPSPDEPFVAALASDEGSQPSESGENGPTNDELDTLAATLANNDLALLAALTGAAEQATANALSRLGAAVRSNKDYAAQIPKNLTNAEVALELGPDGLTNMGVDITLTLTRAFDSMLLWWYDRAMSETEQVKEVLAGYGAAFEVPEANITASVDMLSTTLHASVFSGVDEQGLRAVIARLGE